MLIRGSAFHIGVGVFFGVFAASASAGFFDRDSREWVSEKSSPLVRELAKSVAVQLPLGRIKNASEKFPLVYIGQAQKYQAEWAACDGTRFNEEISLPMCTGTLVGPSTVLTAAHCGWVNEAGCKTGFWVFDYRKDNPRIRASFSHKVPAPWSDSTNEIFNVEIPAESVYRCKRIIASRYDEKNGIDYALIELDRRVAGRKPVPLATERAYPASDRYFTIGGQGGTFLVSTASVPAFEIREKTVAGPFDMLPKGSGGPLFHEKSGSLVGVVLRSNLSFDEGLDPNSVCKKNYVQKSPWEKTGTRVRADGVKETYNVPYTQALRLDLLQKLIHLKQLIR
jgi:hypothetical protein